MYLRNFYKKNGIFLIQGIKTTGKINKKLSKFFYIKIYNFWPQGGTAPKRFEHPEGMVPKTHTKFHNDMPMHS